jgi:pyruvate-ferredoxin/flavodoxin oxidoreductase
MHAELDRVDFVQVNDAAAFRHSRPLDGLVDGGTAFLATPLIDPEAIWDSLPAEARATIVGRHVRLLALDPATLARRHAPSPDLVVRMQGVAVVGVFLRAAPFVAQLDLDDEALFDALRPLVKRYLGKRGSHVVDANLAVIRAAWDGLIDVTQAVVGSSRAPAPAAA